MQGSLKSRPFNCNVQTKDKSLDVYRKHSWSMTEFFCYLIEEGIQLEVSDIEKWFEIDDISDLNAAERYFGMPNFKISLNRARTLIFNKSAEGKKSNLKSLKELHPYIGQKNVTNPNGRIVMSLATGRSGQRWLSRVVNEDNDWVGSCERLKEYEYLLRWLSFNNLRGDRYYEVIDLIRAAAYRDISVAGNSYIASPYFSFSVSDLIHKINPSLFVWQIRDPIEVIQSLYTKAL